jgi:nucleobase:cation symporter-1, NCS1 family
MSEATQETRTAGTDSKNRAGPTRTGDVRVEWRGIEGVPESDRYGKPIRLGFVWFASNATPVCFFIGVIGVTIGLSFWENILAFLLGTLLGSILPAFVSPMGAQSGYPQIALARLPFGKSAPLVGVATYVVTVVFMAVAAVFGVESLKILFHLSLIPALVVTFALEAIVSITGYELFHLFQGVATLLTAIGFVVITIVVCTKANQIHVTQSVHGSTAVGAFLLMTAICLGYNSGWTPYAADYCRYLPRDTSPPRLFGWVYAGLGLSTIWLYILGLAAGAILPNRSPMAAIYDLLGGGVAGVVVLLAMIIGITAYLSACDYSGGLEVQASGIRIPRPFVTALSALLVGIVTWWLSTGGLINKAENIILLATYWTAAFAAIVIIDWRRRSKEKIRVPSLRDLPSGWEAIVALILAYAVCLPFTDTTTGGNLAVHGGPLSVLFGSVSRAGLANGDIGYPVAFVAGWLFYVVLLRVSRSLGTARVRVREMTPEPMTPVQDE